MGRLGSFFGSWFVSGFLLAVLGVVIGAWVFFYVFPGKPKIGGRGERITPTLPTKLAGLARV